MISGQSGLNLYVKTQHRKLFYILLTDAHMNCMSVEAENNYNYYGKVVGGNLFKG